MEWNQIDIEACMLGGKPISVDGIDTYPITFDESTDMTVGYSKYNRAIRLFCIDINQINELFKQELEQNNLYDCLCLLSADDTLLCNDILLILKLVTRQNVSFDENIKKYMIEDKALNSNTFLDIQRIVKIRNGLEDIEEDMENPADERTRQLIAKRNKYREELRASKSNGDDITIIDILSSCAVALHLELSKIYQYDMYQLNNQINRVKMFKDYDINIQALLQGANAKDINLKYWLCSNKKYNDIDDTISEDDYEF